MQVPRRRMPIKVAPNGIVQNFGTTGKTTKINRETLVRSKILSHFIKGKISLSLMETILKIPRKLKHLESLMKLAKCKRNSEIMDNQVSMILASSAIKQICINKTRKNKTLHLLVEINNYVVEGSMSVKYWRIHVPYGYCSS